MCIVKKNLGHEKRNALNTFTVNSLSLALYYKQESKMDHKKAANKFIHRTFFNVHSCRSTIFCRVLSLLPSHYFNNIACSLIKRIKVSMESTIA